MSKLAKLLIVSVVCMFMAATFVSAGLMDFFKGIQGGLISGNVVYSPDKSISAKSYNMKECVSSKYCKTRGISNIFDGDEGTFWYPASSKAYALLDYGELMPAGSRIDFKWSGDKNHLQCSGEILASSDGKKFTSVFKGENLKQGMTSAGASKVAFRYLLVKVGHIKSCGWVSLHEVKVSAAATSTTTPTTSTTQSNPATSTPTSTTPTTSSTQSNPDCLELIAGHNKPNANRINIIFVKSKMSQNTKDTALSILGSGSTSGDSSFMATEPFKSNLNKFNFWYIAKDYDIELKYADDRTQNIASDAFKICNFGSPVFAIFTGNNVGAWGGGLKDPSGNLGMVSMYPFTSAAKTTLIHELGHSIGGLIDEYVTIYGGATGTPVVECDQQQLYCKAKYPNGYAVSFINKPNVFYAKSREECLQNAPWKGMIGKGCGTSAVDCLTPEYYEEFSSNGYMRNDDPRVVLSKSEAAHEIDCFEGAGLLDKGAFRSTFNSIMRFNQISTSKFGPYNEYLITQALNKYSGK